jgi:hypothetical protein
MDGKSKPARTGDRRASDRRVKDKPYPGGDKRAGQRRSLADRRAAPRS